MSPILNETWDMVFADELFGISGMGIAMRNRKLHEKPYIMYSTTVLMHLFSWESALGENLLENKWLDRV